MLSTELRLIIECCKKSLLKEPDEALLEIIETQPIDWSRLGKMIAFHQIRPIVYLALKNIQSPNIDKELLISLGNEVKVKSMYNIFFAREISRLKTFFSEHSIPLIAYKGFAWSNDLHYTTFREGVDMDFLIEKSRIHEALDLLIADGYHITHVADYVKAYKDKELLDYLLSIERTELSLAKKTPYNFLLKFDFHWEILTKPYTYRFDSSVLFTDKFTEQEKLLLLIIMHNGKKESWTKLKYICDLTLFIHNYGQDFNWDSFLHKLDNLPFQKSLLKGLALAAIFLPAKNNIPVSLSIPKPDKLNIFFWENARHYETSIKAKFLSLRLMFKYHSQLSESIYYLRQYIRYQSFPSPQEQRLIVFPPSYSFLNLCSKVVSYFYFGVSRKK